MLPFKVPCSIEEAVQPVKDPRSDETLPARVKELFVIFDRKNCGCLTIDQVGKLLKKLSGFANDEIDGFCSDIDRSKDGKISYKEFVGWVQKSGGKGAEQVAKAMIRETNKRAVRIKASFARYDQSGDGSLDLSELTKVLRTLGAFTNHEIRNVLADLDRNGDGNISFPEFADWVRRATEIQEVIKAKCMLAPSDSDGIEAVFYNFCGPGHADIDGKHFLKLLKDCKLLNNVLTEKSVDLIFSDNRVKPKNQRRVDFSQFEIALELVAEKGGLSVQDVRDAMLESTHPVLKGTKADSQFSTCKNETTKAAELGKTPKLGEQRKSKTHRMSGQLSLGRPTSAVSRTSGQLSMGRPVSAVSRMSGQLPLGRPASAAPVDNTKMWKTFGGGCEAGRCLKRIYTQNSRPASAIATKNRFKPSWPPAMDTYTAVNTLGVCTDGICFRRSMRLSDTFTDPLAVVPWGASIKGELVASCWLRVGKRFLPTSLNGVQVMKKVGPSLGRSCSLPEMYDPEGAVDLNATPSTIQFTPHSWTVSVWSSCA